MTTLDVAGQSLDQRQRFYEVVPWMVAEDPRLALVLAEIGAGYLDPAVTERIADRVVNVGIREQLMIGTAAGLAMTGLRPIVHTFAPFLLERPYEQVKLDLGHQDVGAVLVSAGGSYGVSHGGQTHFGQRDVALLDTLSGWTVHVPGNADEAERLLRRAVRGDDRVYLRLDVASNERGYEVESGRMTVVRRGSRATVVAVGPMLDRVLAATADRDLTVLYAATVRPFDADTLRGSLTAPDVVLVEPYLAGTSVHLVAQALSGVRHRVLGLGVARGERRRYGTPADHDAMHGLDVAGLRRAIDGFVAPGPA
jgi:transketolase